MITQLQDERIENLAQISELNDKVTKLNSQLEHVKKQVEMMTARTDDSARSKPMLEHPKELQYSKIKKKNLILGFVITVKGRVILDLIASRCMVCLSNLSCMVCLSCMKRRDLNSYTGTDLHNFN